MNIFKILTMLIIVLLFSFTKGCVKLPLPQPSTLQFHKLDTSVLKNRVIVIDPGHGGAEHGAVGVKGLRESEINLTAALYLWGLLKQAGAQPILTRSADVLLTQESDFVLRKELLARAAFSNKHEADLFVSIHHNSDTENPWKNHLQVYYKLSDPKASRDIGQEIFVSLKQRLKPSQAELIPGNYAVLRNVHAPAVLGESSFLTNKDNEIQLTFHRTLLNEAEGYFLGILNYYTKGVPEILELKPHNLTVTETQPEITLKLYSGKINEGIKVSNIIFTLDGMLVKSGYSLNHDYFSYKPRHHLSNGKHVFCISYQNKAGNTSSQRCAFFIIDSPACNLKINPLFSTVPPDKKLKLPIDVQVADCFNRPVSDGTKVNFKVTGGTLSTYEVETSKGHARTYLIADKISKESLIQAEVKGIKYSAKVFFNSPQNALLMASVKNLSGEPIKGVRLMRDRQEVSTSDTEGLLYDSICDSGHVEYELSKRGYKSLTSRIKLIKGKLVQSGFLLTSVDEGLFLNRKIMFNIEGSQQAALPLILALKEKIEYAGGSIVLAKEKDLPEEKVINAAKEEVSVFISIEITKNTFSVEHYFRSKTGQMLSKSICQEFEKERDSVHTGKCSTSPSQRFLIIQTEMPSIHLSIPQELIYSADKIAKIIYQSLYEIFKG